MVNRRFYIFLLSLLLLSAVLLTVMRIPPTLKVAGRIHVVPATVTSTFTLVGLVSAWNATGLVPNPTITVTQWDTITIQLSSGDTQHQFFVDVDKNGVIPDCPPGADVCSNPFPPSTSVTFTVNFLPGTYTYYCSIHPISMLGQFVVLRLPWGPNGGGHHVLI